MKNRKLTGPLNKPRFSQSGTELVVDISALRGPVKTVRIITNSGDALLQLPENGPTDAQDAQNAIVATITPGSLNLSRSVPGKGLYGGTIVLPKKFDIALPPATLWVAPENLDAVTDRFMNYDETVLKISTIKNFHGRDGVDIKDRPQKAKDTPYEQALYRYFSRLAAGDRSAKPGWVIPPFAVLSGRVSGKSDVVLENNLYALQDKMKIDLGFDKDDTRRHAHQLLSCTEAEDFVPERCVYSFNIVKGYIFRSYKAQRLFPCRLVCLEFPALEA